jgi:DNA polymerase
MWHADRKPTVYNPTDFKRFCKETDWKRTGVLGHHVAFDGLILSKHFNVVPAFYLDTLSMARPVMTVTAGGSLFALCAAFGRQAKKRGAALLNTKGLEVLDAKQYKQLALYAGDDIVDTWWLFHKLLPFLPPRELHVIDATVRMYASPKILLNGPKVQALHDAEVKAKAGVLKRLKVTAEQLRSKNQFAELLRDAGVEPPIKVSKADAAKMTYAFAKSDLEFKALLGHEDSRVRALVRGRLRLSSSILEKRAQRMAKRAVYGPQPVYLNYALALTHRWTGGDSMNWQNFNRGSELREAIEAPPGYVFVITDKSQIEARINACFAGQKNIVEAFRRGEDVYAIAATGIYGKPIDKKKNPQERFLGKCAVLMLGYQASAPKFANVLRLGILGPPVDITDGAARDIVSAWRSANPFITATWRATGNFLKQAFISKTRVEHGCVAYEGAGAHGYMHLPNGMSIRYCNIDVDDEGGLSYLRKRRVKKKGEPVELRTRIYGGLAVENRTQSLSRANLADDIAEIRIQMPKLQLVMTTHDEVVYLVPLKQAEKAARRIAEIMTTPPSWMPDLPLAVDQKISTFYAKE